MNILKGYYTKVYIGRGYDNYSYDNSCSNYALHSITRCTFIGMHYITHGIFVSMKYKMSYAKICILWVGIEVKTPEYPPQLCLECFVQPIVFVPVYYFLLTRYNLDRPCFDKYFIP